MNWEVFGISIYVVGMISMGFYFSKKIKTDEDYFLGGRSLGSGLATFSIFATWFGAETCIGTAGAVYRDGLSSIHADPLGYTICLLLMAIFFSKVLWRKKITTIPDLFRNRFSPTSEKLAALIMIPSSIIWAGAQIRALGQILQSTTNFGPELAVTIAASVVILYTMFGGMLADAYADLIQGIAIIIGLFFLFFSIVDDLGGFSLAFSKIQMEKLSFGGGEMKSLSFLGRLELWLVPILGSITSQELVSRVVASRSEKIASSSSFRAAWIYFLVGSMPVLIGLLGSQYFTDLKDAETLMPLLAKTHLNYFFYIIFVGALISAILSTVDTTLLASSALLSHNLIYSAFPNIKENKKVIIARSCTLLAGLISYSIAYSSQSIVGLVEFSSSLGGPIILVLTVAAIWDKRGNSYNAIFAMSMGLIGWGVFHFMISVEVPIILTVIICILSYFASMLLTRTVVSSSEHEAEASLGK